MVMKIENESGWKDERKNGEQNEYGTISMEYKFMA